MNIRRDADTEATANAQKAFIFLYPQPDIMDFELRSRSHSIKTWPREKEFAERSKEAKSEADMQALRKEADEDMLSEYRKFYGPMLNACIDARYRQREFAIFFALLDGTQISDVLDVRRDDRVIYVGMDAKTHRTKGRDGKYPYPSQDYILNQLGPVSTLRIGGFHMWDCVEKLARRAHERGLGVLVDEDLTEFFGWLIHDRNFKIDGYPNYNPRQGGEREFRIFMDARKGKPWLWQDY